MNARSGCDNKREVKREIYKRHVGGAFADGDQVEMSAEDGRQVRWALRFVRIQRGTNTGSTP